MNYLSGSGSMEDKFNGIPPEYQEDIDKAVKILKDEGCREMFLFGSLAEGRINESSHIDLAVKGCPPGKFFKLLGKLLLELNHSVDLVNLDQKSDLVQFIEREGVLIHVPIQ
jgi:predicted nucleotidyltransferase